MKANPAKSYVLALKRFDNRYCNGPYTPLTNKSYIYFYPNLFLSGQHIKPISPSGFKYLGVIIEPSLSEDISRTKLKETLVSLITTVNDASLASSAKLYIYNQHIVPRLYWWFATLNLSLSFVKHLHWLVLPFLKRWCGLPRSGNTYFLFLGSKTRPGLRLKHLVTTWKQAKASTLQLLKKSKDRRVATLYADALHKEEMRSTNDKRYALAVELECALASAPIDNARGSNTSIKHVKAHVASYIYEVDSAQQLQHLSCLQMQGCWSEWDGLMNVDFTWNKLIHGTSNGILKFLVNPTTNTLPTLDNLKACSH